MSLSEHHLSVIAGFLCNDDGEASDHETREYMKSETVPDEYIERVIALREYCISHVVINVFEGAKGLVLETYQPKV